MDSLPTQPADTPVPAKNRAPLFVLGIASAAILIFLITRYVVIPYEKPQLTAPSQLQPVAEQELPGVVYPTSQDSQETQNVLPSEPTIGDIERVGLNFHAPPLINIIDGQKYAFLPDANSPDTEKRLAIMDENGVFHLANERFLQILGNYINSRTYSFWIDTNAYEFYLLEGSVESFDQSAAIFQLTFEQNGNDFTLVSKKMVYFVPKLGQMEVISLIDVRADKKAIIIATGVGDGCGAQGTISVVNTQTQARTDVLSYGGGCAPGPGFGGVYQDGRLIVVDRQPTSTSSDPLWIQSEITSLYLLDPFTLQKEVLTTSGIQFADTALLNNATTDFREISPKLMAGQIIFAKSFSSTTDVRSALFRYDMQKRQLVGL